MSKEDEQILVVPRGIVIPEPWYGIKAAGIEGFENLVRAHGQFRRRGDMEENPDFQQIIPYMVFRNRERYFLMQRTNAGAEARLHNLYSLGIGGHINKEDLVGETIMDWARREFDEEVDYLGSFVASPIGLLNDDSNAVGRVHLGYVLLLEGNSDQIRVRDEHVSGRLMTLYDMRHLSLRMESWSSITWDHLAKEKVLQGIDRALGENH